MKNHPKKRTACLVPRPSQLVLRAHNGLSREVYFAVCFPREIGTWLEAAAVRTVKTKGVSGKNDDFAHAFYILFHFQFVLLSPKEKWVVRLKNNWRIRQSIGVNWRNRKTPVSEKTIEILMMYPGTSQFQNHAFPPGIDRAFDWSFALYNGES